MNAFNFFTDVFKYIIYPKRVNCSVQSLPDTKDVFWKWHKSPNDWNIFDERNDYFLGELNDLTWATFSLTLLFLFTVLFTQIEITLSSLTENLYSAAYRLEYFWTSGCNQYNYAQNYIFKIFTVRLKCNSKPEHISKWSHVSKTSRSWEICWGFKDKAKYYGSPNHLNTFHILN